ncbi:MAG: endonuclease/exonuclease/phosphatase family protein [Rhodothermales bacterium]
MLRRLKRSLKSDPYRELRATLSARVPYLASYHPADDTSQGPANEFTVASYNVHRWTGLAGGKRMNPDLALHVLTELGADIIALQEVLRVFDGRDPLTEIAEELGYHVAFATTRIHRRGELGNALLARWPMKAVHAIDLNFGRFEQRSALGAQFSGHSLSVVATHLALVDRTRRRQVHSILQHPRLQGPTLLLGDMNAWRKCPASRQLDDAFVNLHHNRDWPPTYPATRPVLALDRIYARGATVEDLRAYSSASSRRGSDHLPILARIALTDEQQ